MSDWRTFIANFISSYIIYSSGLNDDDDYYNRDYCEGDGGRVGAIEVEVWNIRYFIKGLL